MRHDSAATREAILRAAIDEFAARGLAGGRIDRIAAASGANPKSIYSYYGNKTALFDAAVTAVLKSVGERVSIDPLDLPASVGALFDDVMAHPEAVRLNRWRQLERPDSGPDDTDVYRTIVARMSTPVNACRSKPAMDRGDALILSLSLASAWLDISRDVLRSAMPQGVTDTRLARHRAAVVEAVKRITEP